jgi:thioredoxin 1
MRPSACIGGWGAASFPEHFDDFIPSGPIASGHVYMRRHVMAKPVEVTDQTFQSQVLSNPLPVLVDFWATWCPPCRMIAPYIEQIATDFEGKVAVCKVDVDNNQAVAHQFNIRSIPTLLFFKDGAVKEQVIGALPKEQLVAKVNALLS